MKPITAWLIILGAVTVALPGGCALLSKGTPGHARFFSFEPPPVEATPALRAGESSDTAARVAGPALRLGRVTGAAHLEERVVFRDTADEVSYYADVRWTAPPNRFLERRLAHALFEEHEIRQRVSGPGLTLDVALTAFEEIRTDVAPTRPHRVRVQVVARLHDDHIVRWTQTIREECLISAEDGLEPVRATVAALGRALQATVARVASRVVRDLTAAQMEGADGAAGGARTPAFRSAD